MIQTDELILCDTIIINFKPSLTVWKMQNDPISYQNLSDIRAYPFVCALHYCTLDSQWSSHRDKAEILVEDSKQSAWTEKWVENKTDLYKKKACPVLSWWQNISPFWAAHTMTKQLLSLLTLWGVKWNVVGEMHLLHSLETVFNKWESEKVL